MAPDAGVHVEVAGEVALLARIVPEVQGHGGDGLGADQFAHFADQRLAILAPGLDRAAELAALHLARHLW
jgi:hypothetical protein